MKTLLEMESTTESLSLNIYLIVYHQISKKCICFWHRLRIKSENCPLAINVSVFHLNLLRKLTKHKIQNTPILLSPAPDQFVIPLAPARRIRRREKLILSLQGYRTFMNEPVFSQLLSQDRQGQLWSGYITSIVSFYLLNYACSVFCSDQLKSKT